MRRGEHQRIARAAGRGHDHDDLAHAGDLRRDRVHQHRRRIRGLAARHVDADAVERRHLLAELACRRRRDSDHDASLLPLVVTRGCAPRRCRSASRCARRQRVERVAHLAPPGSRARPPTARRRGRSGACTRAARRRRARARRRGFARPSRRSRGPARPRTRSARRARASKPGAARVEAAQRRASRRVHARSRSLALAVAPPARARRAAAARASRFSLSAPGLTTSRALIGMMSSTATRSFAFSVLPVRHEVDDRVGEARPAAPAPSSRRA